MLGSREFAVTQSSTLQFTSHRFFVLVVTCLAPTLYMAVTPSKFRSTRASVPNQKGGGAVSGSTWVLRVVACPRRRERKHARWISGVGVVLEPA